MKKIIYLIVVVFTIATKTQAQEIDTDLLLKAYQASDCVFEGIIEEKCSYEEPSTGNIYTSNRVKITKIIKGNLTCGTVNIVTLGGQINEKTLEVSHQTEFTIGAAGIYMCVYSNYPEPNCISASNKLHLELTISFNGTLDYLFDRINKEVVGLNSRFNTIEELYAFLALNGINVIDCNSNAINSLRNESKNHLTITEQVLERKPTQYSIDKVLPSSKYHLISKFDEVKNTKLNKAGETLEFLISNIGLSGNGCNKEYVVEISVKANVSNIYLQGALFRLKYNKLALGTNISSIIAYTRTSDFPSSAYGFVGGFDVNDSVFQFSIQNTALTSNYTQISTTPKRLITLRIPVTNCKILGNFVIEPFPNNNLTFFSNSPTTDQFNTFSNIIYGAKNVGYTCQPSANTITSLPFNAGRGEILTITGCNFGNIKGDISMRNADNPNVAFIKLDKYDITEWTNTQIKVRIPSRVDSGDLSGTTYNVHPIGTGNLTITDAYGNIDPVSQNIKINNSVYNQNSASIRKRNVFLYSNNTDGKYHFKLHPNITNPKMIDCIKAALRRWRCTTGIPFILDNGTSNSNYVADGVNIIKLGSVSTSPIGIVMARTLGRAWNCAGSSQTLPFAIYEVDIEINETITKFKFDTTGSKNIEADSVDFFQVILHEIGHGLGLEHTLNNLDIMYPSTTTGFQQNSNRRIYIKNNDLDGANYQVNNSTPSRFTGDCSYPYPIIKQPTNCFWNNSIEDKTNDANHIKISPNPFSNELTINIEVMDNAISQIRIFDITGNLVFKNDEQKLFVGNNQIQLENLNLNNGLYFINVDIEGKIFNLKALCQKQF